MVLYPTPIADGAIDLTPAPPEFVKSFRDTVGTSGTPQDGFDRLLLPADMHLADAPNFLRGLDIGLGDLGLMQKEIGAPFHADFEQHLTATIQQGQPDFNAYAVHLTGKNPPAPAPPPSPVQGGGGLQPVAFSDLVEGGASASISVPFVNPFNYAIHPTGVAINQGRLAVFVAVSECGAVIPANGRCNIVVTFRPLLVGHYAGLLVFNTDDPNSPYTLGISGTVLPRGSAPPPPPPPPRPGPRPGPGGGGPHPIPRRGGFGDGNLD